MSEKTKINRKKFKLQKINLNMIFYELIISFIFNFWDFVKLN